MLTKEECLFERDENGNLLGKKIIVNLLDDKPEIIVKPLTRGQLNRLYNKAKNGTEEEKENSDVELIIEGLIEPKFTEEEVKCMKPKYALALTTTILSISLGKEQEEVSKLNEEVVQEELSLKN